MVFIIKGQNGQRAHHWNDIRTRVRTHEGELLSGKAGERYQARYAKQYLGKDLGVAKRYSAQDVEQHEKSKNTLNKQHDSNNHSNTRFPIYTGK